MNRLNENFSNSHPVNHGEILLQTNNIFKVGEDLSNKFKDTIKLQDGSPLKLSMDDYVLQCRLIKGSQGGEPIQNVKLPLPLFIQARKGNRIYFSLNNENFALKLSPCQSWHGSELNVSSFDDGLAAIIKQGCTEISMYEEKIDIPKGYLRWGDAIDLSPEAQRLEIGKRGCIPTNSQDLMLDLKFVSNEATPCTVEALQLDDGLILSIGLASLSPESQKSLINVNLIVDSNRLYLHSYPKKGNENLVGEHFYWINLKAGALQIDKEAILATPLPNGILQIELPYLNKQETATKESILSEKEEAYEAQKRKPIDFDLKDTNLINDKDVESVHIKEISENAEKLAAILAPTKQGDLVESDPDEDPPMGNESIEKSQTTAVFDQNYQNSDEDYHIEEISSTEEDKTSYCKIS